MQEVGSDTMSRDEVTGLAAFDNLDQVSTLNIMPDPPAPAPRVFSPPPAPAGYSNTQQPMAATRPGASMPPPVARTFSRPPGMPMPSANTAQPMAALRSDATELLDVEPENETDTSHAQSGGDYEDWEDADDAATRVARPILEANAAGGSAELQMDWDDEELPTQMRGEGHLEQIVREDGWNEAAPQSLLGDEAATAAYEPVPATLPSGRPSPFPSGRPSSGGFVPSAGAYAPATHGTSTRPGAPSPFARAAQDDTAWGQDLRDDKKPWLWVALGVVAIIALSFAARAFLAPPKPGFVTLTTVPADAHVTIDGKALTSTSSPYSATDIAPGVSHELVVSKDGFTEQRTTFTLKGGETKALDEITLAANAQDVGFSITSDPAGADVLVDGQSVGQVTPARVTHVPAGLHKVELTHDGYRPFEVQLFVPEHGMVELPAATLAAATGKAAASKPEVGSAAAEPLAASADDAEHHHHHHHDDVTSSVAAAPAAPHVAATKPAKAVKAVAAAPAVVRPVAKAETAAAGKGILRVNSRPWAQVLVDGKLVGNTPQMGLQLTPGNHTIKLVNGPMGLSKSFPVTVKAGQTITKVMNLIE